MDRHATKQQVEFPHEMPRGVVLSRPGRFWAGARGEMGSDFAVDRPRTKGVKMWAGAGNWPTMGSGGSVDRPRSKDKRERVEGCLPFGRW